MGDLRAQVTAVKTGERRFLRADRALRPRARCSAPSPPSWTTPKRAARARTRTHPRRRLRGRVLHGRRRHRDRQARCRSGCESSSKGDEMTIDLTDVSRQVRGFYNSGITTGYACAQVAYKCLTSPTDYPINDGSFRSLKAIVPPGRVVSAARPAPMRWWMTYPMTIVDTVFKALAPAIPDRVIAGHHADLLIAALPRHQSEDAASSSSAASARSAAAGAPSTTRTASPPPSASTTATPTTARTSRPRPSFPIVVERYRAGAGFRRRRPPARRARRRARDPRAHAT